MRLCSNAPITGPRMPTTSSSAMPGALSRHINLDDHQVEWLVVQKFEPGLAFTFQNLSKTFALILEKLIELRSSSQ
jgi:hypothetical protein